MSSSSPIPNQQQTLPFHWQFTAGAVAGICEIVCMYPLDIVKTRFQLNTSQLFHSSTATSSSSHVSKPSILGTLRQIVSEEGFFHLYRGMLAPIMVEAPKRATKFASNDLYSKYLTQYLTDSTGTSLNSSSSSTKQRVAVLAGIGAGMTEAFIVVSFDVVKIRMQDPSRLGQYRNTIDCLQQIVRYEGPRALTQGLEATIWRHGAWNGGYFGVIFAVKDWLASMPMYSTHESLRNFIAGTIGGIVGTVCNTPFDVVKTRIQNQDLTRIASLSSSTSSSSSSTLPPSLLIRKYKWALPGLLTVVREEGVLALYKGFVPKVLRLGPGGGILLVMYEAVLSLIRTHLQ